MPEQLRKLAAIMFTDIVGYTAMMGENEEKAFALLRKNRQIQKPIIEKYGGKWLKEMGDGVLASFTTVSDAVYCAAAIQDKTNNEPDLQLRIGIHQGEVVFEGDDVFGDGVNIASRLEALAPGGGIWVSESVSRNIQNKQGIETEFVREEQLKNVKDLVRIYKVKVIGKLPAIGDRSNEDVQTPSHRSHRFNRFGSLVVVLGVILFLAYSLYTYYSSEDQIIKVEEVDKSIAVLPFSDMSKGQDQQYFCDGMMDAIINHLTKIPQLRVISRTTSVSYRNTSKTIPEIGGELGIAYILEGGVQHQNNKVRITVQLIDVIADKQIWSKNYDRDMFDIFKIQSDVANQIANILYARIDPEVQRRIELDPQYSTDAYILYLKARLLYELNIGTRNLNTEPVEKLLKQVIVTDSLFAPAYSTLAEIWINKGNFVGTLRSSEVLQHARPLVKKAIKIDPNLYDAHVTKGLMHLWYEWDFNKCNKEFQIASRLNPGIFKNSGNFSDFLIASGKFQESLEFTYKAELPLGSLILPQYFTSKHDTALATMHKVLNSESPNLLSLIEAARVFNYLGMSEPAMQILEELYAIVNLPRFSGGLSIAFLQLGDTTKANQFLVELQNKSEESPVGSPAFYAAMTYARMEEYDKSFEWLEKAYQDHEVEMYWLNVEPFFKPMYEDPRWRSLVGRFGFPE